MFLEVWGQALNAVRVDTESEFWALDKVYYLLALHLAPTFPQPPADLSSAPHSSLAQPNDASSFTSAKSKDKKKELPLPVDIEAKEETAEVEQLKRKKKEKELEKKGAKEKDPMA